MGFGAHIPEMKSILTPTFQHICRSKSDMLSQLDSAEFSVWGCLTQDGVSMCVRVLSHV